MEDLHFEILEPTTNASGLIVADLEARAPATDSPFSRADLVESVKLATDNGAESILVVVGVERNLRLSETLEALPDAMAEALADGVGPVIIQPVGYCLVHSFKSSSEISTIHVQPESRRQRVASRLLDSAVNACRKASPHIINRFFVDVDEHNDKGIQFFRRLGRGALFSHGRDSDFIRFRLRPGSIADSARGHLLTKTN